VTSSDNTYVPIKSKKLQSKDKKKAPSGKKDSVDLNPTLDMSEEDALEEALSLRQRIKKGINMRRQAPKLAVARRRAMRRRAQRKVLTRRSRKQAIKDVKTKFSGGRDVTKLSAAEKSRVEGIIKKRGAIVNRMARKLYIGKKQSERKRLNNEFEASLQDVIGIMETALDQAENEQVLNQEFSGSFANKSFKDFRPIEEMKLVMKHDHPSNGKSAKVYHDREWGEYRVKHFTGNKHHKDADYHTDEKDDAHGTAKAWVKEEVKPLIKEKAQPAEEMTKNSFGSFIKKVKAGAKLDKRKSVKSKRILSNNKVDEENIDEVSAKTLRSYIDKSTKDVNVKNQDRLKDDPSTPEHAKKVGKITNRMYHQDVAKGKLFVKDYKKKNEEVESLDELAARVLSRYQKNAQKASKKIKDDEDIKPPIKKDTAGVTRKEEKVGGVAADDFIQKEDNSLNEAYEMYEKYIERSEKANLVDKLVLTICEYYSLAPNELKDFIASKEDK
jgi:hypothetical protein